LNLPCTRGAPLNGATDERHAHVHKLHTRASTLSLTPFIYPKHTTSCHRPQPTVAMRPQIHCIDLFPPPHLCRPPVSLGDTRLPLSSRMTCPGERQPPPFRSSLLPTKSPYNPTTMTSPPQHESDPRQTRKATPPHSATAPTMQSIVEHDKPYPLHQY